MLARHPSIWRRVRFGVVLDIRIRNPHDAHLIILVPTKDTNNVQAFLIHLTANVEGDVRIQHSNVARSRLRHSMYNVHPTEICVVRTELVTSFPHDEAHKRATPSVIAVYVVILKRVHAISLNALVI